MANSPKDVSVNDLLADYCNVVGVTGRERKALENIVALARNEGRLAEAGRTLDALRSAGSLTDALDLLTAAHLSRDRTND